MGTASDGKRLDWIIMMIYSALTTIRFVLRLISGPPELGQAGNGERLTFWIGIVMTVVLTISLLNLEGLTKGREHSRTLTLIVLLVGLASTISLLVLGD
jgi:hypothetical protein